MSTDRTPDLFDYIIDEKEPVLNQIYSTILAEMTSFIIAHELAHIRFGHLESTSEQITTNNNGKIEVVNFEWEDEAAADKYAAILLFNPQRRRGFYAGPLSENSDHFLLILILSGIVVFFNISRSLEFYRDQMIRLQGTIQPLSPIHPPSKERMEFILNALYEKKVVPKDPSGTGIADVLIGCHYFNENKIWENMKSKITD